MFDPATVSADLRVSNDAELARVEEAGLNAAQPTEQLLVDGWLLRFCAGKARRARSVNAIGAGRLSLDAKLDICRRHYGRAQLPLLVRITPFSAPAELDRFLAGQDFEAVDQTRVMTCSMTETASGREKFDLRMLDVEPFAAIVGALRGSPSGQIQSHARRLQASPLLLSSYRCAIWQDGQPIAAGQIVIEDALAGLYDIVTAPAHRAQGLGTALSSALLAAARRLGARLAYLQVDAGNAAARRVYGKLGFVDRYAYWYRQPRGTVDPLLN